MELYYKYTEEVKAEDKKIAKEKAEAVSDSDDDEDEEQVEYYMRRLESGLFALQSICYIIMDISVNGPSGIATRVTKLLNLRNEPKSNLIQILKEYKENLGEADIKEKNQKEEGDRIDQLIESFNS